MQILAFCVVGMGHLDSGFCQEHTLRLTEDASTENATISTSVGVTTKRKWELFQ